MESVSETESDVLSINGDGDGDDDDASTGTVDISTDATMPPLDEMEAMTPGPIVAPPDSFERSGKVDDGEESWINPFPPKPSTPVTPNAERRTSHHHHARSQSMTSTAKFTLVSPPSSDSSSAHSQQFPFPVSSTEDTPGEDTQSKRSHEPKRDSRMSRVTVGNGT